MKKIILLLAVINSMATIINAQDEGPQFGLKIGANYSNVYDAKGEEFTADGKAGLAAGAFLTIPIGKYLGFQPEVLFSQKGFQASGSVLGSSYSFTRTTNHLDIPLLIAVKPSKFLTLKAGPQYSYLLKQNDNFSNSFFSTELEEEFNNDNIRKNTLSLLVGGDINIDRVVIGARAGWDIQDNKGDGSSNTPRYKNVWYQGTIGFRF